MSNILEEYRAKRATEEQARKDAQNEKSFTEAADNLFEGAEVEIVQDEDGAIVGQSTTVETIRDTLFTAGGVKFYKEISRVLADGSTEHLPFSNKTHEMTAIVRRL